MRQLVIAVASVASACWSSPTPTQVASPASAPASAASVVIASPAELLAAVTAGTSSLVTAVDPHEGIIHLDYMQMAYVDDATPIEEHLCAEPARALARSLDTKLQMRVHQNDAASDFARCDTVRASKVTCGWGGVGEGSALVRLDFVDGSNGWRLIRIIVRDAVATESWDQQQDDLEAAALLRLGGVTCH